MLEPAFVVEAPPVLPRADGECCGVGRTPERSCSRSASTCRRRRTAARRSSVRGPAEWAGRLARITLAGPAGSASLDRNGGPSMDRARSANRSRAWHPARPRLRERVGADTDAANWADEVLGPGLEILFSQGVPDGVRWGRWSAPGPCLQDWGLMRGRCEMVSPTIP